MTELERFVCLLGHGLTPDQGERLYRHQELLAKWNKKINLTAVASMEAAARRHYVESLFVVDHLPAGPLSLLDLGSGAGFPGIPIAVARPDVRVTLAEATQRKAAFLKEATRDLPNVRVLALRAEVIKETFDWVTLRAVRWEMGFARLGRSFALLLSDMGLDRPGTSIEVSWQDPIRLPGSDHGVLLLGRKVPRGT
jgi:16S rRNA (guanine527-N7)-methyltransferase